MHITNTIKHEFVYTASLCAAHHLYTIYRHNKLTHIYTITHAMEKFREFSQLKRKEKHKNALTVQMEKVLSSVRFVIRV